ncbi:hypothetical protein PGIGA_G00240380 [Pangasianodon gigas]|uniref:Uncharacterized protein n=1 Tax=Pangasianodon gigas TaxID=30993 RepID=A0ACC5WN49_PANGG|nr:hypothetical protein [Pangasianodon gigas]
MNESMERFYTLLLLAGLLCATPAAGVESERKQERPCLSSEFSCSNGQCVDHSWRCDHSEDCEDGSDEENCEENECEVNNGGCSHYCVDQPLGFVCDCPSGMRLVQDTHCEEVEPCLDADVCDQVCVHSNGSFTCECGHGYVMSSESGRCLAAGDAAAVIFSSSEGIMWMKPDGSEQKKIINSTGTSGALTSLTADNTLYWANTEHTHVYRLVLDAGDQEPSVMFSGASGIVGLAVDWINEVLYWTSIGTGAVHAAALNGTQHAPLISGLSSPTAVAVQPLVGFLFWADAGVSPRIERSGLKGQNRKTLVTSAIRNPVSIALGDAAAVIFSSSEGIMWMKPDGSEQKKIINSTGTSGALTSLTADNTLYWANTEHTHVYRLVLDAGDQEPSVMFSGASGIVGLAVDWINEVLYWTSIGTGAVHAAALNGTQHAPLISGLSSPTAVAVQPLVGFLFWADAGVSPRIERSGLKGQNRKTLVTSAIRNPVSIALDVPRGLLYWADSRLNTVSRVTYDGLHRKTVVESNGYLDQPFGLAVFESGVYWSDRHTGAICHADKHNGNLLKITKISGVSSLAGLLVYHRVLQPTVSETTTSPAKPDSTFFFSWILSLIVLPCVLFAALFRYWKMGKFSSSLSRFPGEPMMKESRDPLVPSGDPEAHADKDMFPVPV